jgi:hypothetical protein
VDYGEGGRISFKVQVSSFKKKRKREEEKKRRREEEEKRKRFAGGTPAVPFFRIGR